MLGRKDYAPEELDQAKTAVTQTLTAYRKLTTAADGNEEVRSALEALEPVVFNNLVLALDRYFVHRLRVVTGKDTNPLNEVELLADSLINNGGELRTNNVIKYRPAEAVLELQAGDPIRLTAAGFDRLSEAFLGEIESKFVA